MSQAQTPPNRMLGSTGWRRHARILIIILGTSGLAIVAVVLLNSGPVPKKATLVSATSIPSTYTPTPPPDIIRAAAQPGPPPGRPTSPMQAAVEQPKIPPPPSIQV